MYQTEFQAINAALQNHNHQQIILDKSMLVAIDELMQVRLPPISQRSFSTVKRGPLLDMIKSAQLGLGET